MTYSFADNDEPLYVSEGDYVQFRFKAPNQWDTRNTITITIGDLVQYWAIITIPEDFTPDPFPFNNIPEAELDTLYTYGDGARAGESIITVSGLTPTTQASVALGCNLAGGIDVYAMRLDYNGDGTWDTGWIQGDGTQVVENGAKIQVRARSSPFIVQYTRLTLVIGTSNERWEILTKAGDANEPNPFPDFTDLTGKPTNSYVYSEVIRVQGLIADAIVTTSSPGEWASSSTNTTTTNADGYEVLDGANWVQNGTIPNDTYLQLRILTSAFPVTPTSTSLSIGDTQNGDTWTVSTGQNPSTNPNFFSFQNVPDAIEDFLQPSDQQPAAGISGLGTGVSVPVEVISTDSSLVRVKVNDGSVGVFPTQVQNGDKLTIYLQTASTFSTTKNLQIRVGDRDIDTWQVQTSSGPDTDASFTPPANKNNQVPGTFVASAPVAVSGINRPITIEAQAFNAPSPVGIGYDALISIDFDTPILGPRTFDPSVNSSFYIVVQTSTNLNTPEYANIRVGTGPSSTAEFTWTVTTYAVVPPPATNLGTWYSKKTNKFDGYSLGTILPILKEGVDDYGDLDGGVNDRYPGFIVCDGRSLDTAQYWALWTAIGNQYGGDGQYDELTKTYSGSFNVPDYRNRRLCGVGIVNNQRGNSAFLPIEPGSSLSINDPGAVGGYWYFNKVGSRGSNPIDQVQGAPGSAGSLDSDFFSLGTVRLQGLDTIEDNVTFTVNPTGFVTAQIGPMNSITVQAPQHSHAYFSAVVEGDGGDASIPWGQPQGRSMFGTNAEYSRTERGAESQEEVYTEWSSWLNSLGNFKVEWQKYFGSTTDFDTWVRQNFPNSYPVNEEIPTNGSTDFGSDSDDAQFDIDFLTWWISPVSALSSATLQYRADAAGSNRHVAGVFDTQPATFRIDSYLSTASGNETLTHRHLITENPVGNLNADFTGGNFNDEGSNVSPYGSGLGGGVDGALLTFNLRWSDRYVLNGAQDPTGGGGGDGGTGEYFPAGTGEWSYRVAGASYWTDPTDEETRDEDMIYADGASGSGSGMRLRITYQAWPSGSGGSAANDTRIRIDQILDPGSGYAAGEQLTTTFWNDSFDGSANRILQIANVSDAGTGGAAAQIQVNFTQSDIFMDMTEGSFKYSSSFTRPFPDVEMRPQRQVPIINPFHKAKYVIKAY